MQETILFDGHVHIYPNLDLSLMIKNTLKNAIIAQRTSSNRDDAIKMWLLAERHDCSVFDDLSRLPEIDGFTVHKTKEDESLLIKNADTKEPVLYVLAGRQIISKNNLEICCIGSRYSQKDRSLTEAKLVEEINNSRGAAVINWAPGKWFGARGKIVQNLFNSFTPEQVLICDTTMRPTFWPTPTLMASAVKKGFKVIGGSDPLPFDGEEKMVATYASIISGEFDYERPADSLKKMLVNPDAEISRCGSRSKTTDWLGRQTKIMKA